jgi:hypothetical protein
MRRIWKPTRKVTPNEFVTVPGQNRNGAATWAYKGHTFPLHSYAEDWSIMIDEARDILRFETQQGENAYFDARAPVTRERAEISWESPTYPHGEDLWFHGFLYCAPFSGSMAGQSQYPIVMQWHDTGDVGDAGGMAPPVCLDWTGTQLRMQWAYSATNPFSGSVSAGNKLVGTVLPGRWYNVVMRVKVNADGLNGEVDVYLDGVLANPDGAGGTYRGNTGTPNLLGMYWKLGIYRFTDTPTISIAWHAPTVSTTSLLSRKNAKPPVFTMPGLLAA